MIGDYEGLPEVRFRNQHDHGEAFASFERSYEIVDGLYVLGDTHISGDDARRLRDLLIKHFPGDVAEEETPRRYRTADGCVFVRVTNEYGDVCYESETNRDISYDLSDLDEEHGPLTLVTEDAQEDADKRYVVDDDNDVWQLNNSGEYVMGFWLRRYAHSEESEFDPGSLRNRPLDVLRNDYGVKGGPMTYAQLQERARNV